MWGGGQREKKWGNCSGINNKKTVLIVILYEPFCPDLRIAKNTEYNGYNFKILKLDNSVSLTNPQVEQLLVYLSFIEDGVNSTCCCCILLNSGIIYKERKVFFLSNKDD